jgi:cobalt/nickel transport system permease protein
VHIPDGFLDARTAAATLGAAAAGIGYAARRARRHLPPRKVPLLGLTAAFVFTAQMINFPVVGGTSGHLLGGVLAAVLLGPSAALLALTSVLVVQCLLFADGGLLVIGANILNMGIVGAAGGYGIYRLVRFLAPGTRGRIMAAAFASWCSVVLAATACAAELSFSGTVPWNLAFPAMAGIHMLIGIGEGIITALVLAAIAATRPDLLRPEEESSSGPRLVGVIACGLVLVTGVSLLAPHASPWPDGLEKVAERLGFLGKTAGPARAPMPGYAVPGVGSAALATALAGALGTVVMLGFAFILARVLMPGRARGTDASAADHASRLPRPLR